MKYITARRSPTALTHDVAQQVLDMLESGTLDEYTNAMARERLRVEALRSLGRVAEVVAVREASRRGGRTVVVRCPNCSRRHTHGWPQSDTVPGWRRPHCHIASDYSDYYVPAPMVAVQV